MPREHSSVTSSITLLMAVGSLDIVVWSCPLRPRPRGRCATLGWLAISHGLSAEVMARQGFDALCIDLQHVQWHAYVVTNPLAMVFKILGGCLQAMVHMHRQNLPRPTPCTSVQKRSGICAAAVGDSEWEAWRKSCNRRVQRAGHGATAKAYLPLALVSVNRP